MAVLQGRDGVSGYVERQGYWEWRSPEEMLTVRGGAKVTLPSERGERTFLDVGANLGWYSFLYAQAGWNVVAVEPMTRNRQAIRATLCLNPWLGDRFRLVSAALSTPGDVGPCVITAVQRNAGNGKLTCGPAAQSMNCTELLNARGRCKNGELRKHCKGGSYEFARCEHVPLRTIDSVLGDGDGVHAHVLKME